MWCDCQRGGLEAILQSVCDITKAVYSTYDIWLCLMLGQCCPWKTNMRKIGFHLKLDDFYFSIHHCSILFDAYSPKCRGLLITINPSMAVKLCLLCAAFLDYGDLTNTQTLFIPCWSGLGSWITLGPRSIYRFSINSWLLDYCFIFVK